MRESSRGWRVLRSSESGARRKSACAIVLSLLVSCQHYQLSDVRSTLPAASLDLPAGHPDYLVIQLENTTKAVMCLAWGRARIRDANGFELPATVVPASALSELYPGGRVEYQIVPKHLYTQGFGDAAQVDASLVPRDALQTLRPYKLGVILPVRRAEASGCEVEGESSDRQTWRLEVIEGVVREAP